LENVTGTIEEDPRFIIIEAEQRKQSRGACLLSGKD
jgi:hypothetical protein